MKFIKKQFNSLEEFLSHDLIKNVNIDKITSFDGSVLTSDKDKLWIEVSPDNEIEMLLLNGEVIFENNHIDIDEFIEE